MKKMHLILHGRLDLPSCHPNIHGVAKRSVGTVVKISQTVGYITLIVHDFKGRNHVTLQNKTKNLYNEVCRSHQSSSEC